MGDNHIEYTVHNTIPHTSRSHRTRAETILPAPNFSFLLSLSFKWILRPSKTKNGGQPSTIFSILL